MFDVVQAIEQEPPSGNAYLNWGNHVSKGVPFGLSLKDDPKKSRARRA
ncbi:hypothetical protein SAURM35S_04028 [Streptomyces aurantiogriseus]